MFLIENVAVILRAVLAVILAVSAFFLVCVFYRRVKQKRYQESREGVRARYAQSVDDCLNGTIDVAAVAALLKAARSAAEREGVRELLISRAGPDTIHRITEIVYATGEARRWARAVFGNKRGDALVEAAAGKGEVGDRRRRWRVVDAVRRMQIFALPRAIAVRHLGRLAPAFAHPLLAEAMHDPAPYVRQTAVAAMGSAGFPAAIPIILDELSKAVQSGNEISVRNVKNALVRYGVDHLDRFIPWLTNADARVRFLVTDAAREICGRAARRSALRKNDFSPRVYTVFLDVISCDANPDVRARCAEVICHFHDDRSQRCLVRLMDDENEFVRLHAVRAARDDGELVQPLLGRISDRCWRVREAAVNALAGLGGHAVNAIYSYFITCDDRYGSEQIADEIQRGGLVPRLLATAAAGSDSRLALAACRKLVGIGKTSLLLSALPVLDSAETQIEILDAMSESPTPRFLEVLAELSHSAAEPVRRAAMSLLRKFELQRLKAAAGMD